MGIVDKFENKKVLIWGYGREGKSTENFLKKKCENVNIEIFEGKREEFSLEDYDYVIKSPGIPCFESDERLTNQTQLFLEEFSSQVIGITGTKGKSTTASMLYHVLKECNKDTILVGNIGLPCLDHFDEITENTAIVFEMSCHQLNNITVSPHVAVILNLYQEHLDYYDTCDRYYAAKKNITKYQKKEDFLIMGDNVGDVQTDASVNVFWQDKDYDIELSIPGKHNKYNAEIVKYISQFILGCSVDEILSAMKGFKGLAHRMEAAGVYKGIAFIDDSISTIPEAAICAANSIEGAQTMLIGGMDRGIDYELLVKFIEARPELKFICAYASGERIYEQVKVCDNTYCVKDLEEAIKLAYDITEAGHSCILSPAAASYGYFKNFEERGDRFKELVATYGQQ